MESNQSREEFLAERKIDLSSLNKAESVDAEKQRIFGIIKTVRLIDC